MPAASPVEDLLRSIYADGITEENPNIVEIDDFPSGSRERWIFTGAGLGTISQPSAFTDDGKSPLQVELLGTDGAVVEIHKRRGFPGNRRIIWDLEFSILDENVLTIGIYPGARNGVTWDFAKMLWNQLTNEISYDTSGGESTSMVIAAVRDPSESNTRSNTHRVVIGANFDDYTWECLKIDEIDLTDNVRGQPLRHKADPGVDVNLVDLAIELTGQTPAAGASNFVFHKSIVSTLPDRVIPLDGIPGETGIFVDRSWTDGVAEADEVYDARLATVWDQGFTELYLNLGSMNNLGVVGTGNYTSLPEILDANDRRAADERFRMVAWLNGTEDNNVNTASDHDDCAAGIVSLLTTHTRLDGVVLDLEPFATDDNPEYLALMGVIHDALVTAELDDKDLRCCAPANPPPQPGQRWSTSFIAQIAAEDVIIMTMPYDTEYGLASGPVPQPAHFMRWLEASSRHYLAGTAAAYAAGVGGFTPIIVAETMESSEYHDPQTENAQTWYEAHKPIIRDGLAAHIRQLAVYWRFDLTQWDVDRIREIRRAA